MSNNVSGPRLQIFSVMSRVPHDSVCFARMYNFSVTKAAPAVWLFLRTRRIMMAPVQDWLSLAFYSWFSGSLVFCVFAVLPVCLGFGPFSGHKTNASSEAVKVSDFNPSVVMGAALYGFKLVFRSASPPLCLRYLVNIRSAVCLDFHSLYGQHQCHAHVNTVSSFCSPANIVSSPLPIMHLTSSLRLRNSMQKPFLFRVVSVQMLV